MGRLPTPNFKNEMLENKFIQVALVSLLYTIIRHWLGFEVMVTIALATIVTILIGNSKK